MLFRAILCRWPCRHLCRRCQRRFFCRDCYLRHTRRARDRHFAAAAMLLFSAAVASAAVMLRAIIALLLSAPAIAEAALR